MRSGLVIAAGVALAGACAGQVYTSPPPICFAINDTSTLPAPANTFPSGQASYYGTLLIHFAAPITSTIERLDMVLPQSGFSQPPGLIVTVFGTQFLGGPPGGAPIGSFQGATTAGSQQNWAPLGVLGGPASLIGGQTYALSVQGVPPSPYNSSQLQTACTNVCFAWAGLQVPYQFTPYGSCGAGIPAVGTVGLMARFRGTGCGPGPLASVASIGIGCGIATGGGPQLFSSTPPVLGSVWSATMFGLAGAPASLYWSNGVNAAGSFITAGSTCLMYLDSASFASLNGMGLEPFAAASIPANGTLVWTGLVPSIPSAAGYIIGVQALVIDPTGTLPLCCGMFGKVTNALQLTLGY